MLSCGRLQCPFCMGSMESYHLAKFDVKPNMEEVSSL